MRRLAIILGSFGAIIAAVVLTVPWWLGGALSWIGPSQGLRFERYESLGYGRFRLEKIEFRRTPVRVRIECVEADTPVVWIWRRLTGTPGTVLAGAWETEVDPPSPARRVGAARGWVPLRARLETIANALADWLPEARTGAGTVTWTNGRLTFAPVTWSRRVLACPEVGYRRLRAAVELAVPAGEAWRAVVRAPDIAAAAELRSAGAIVDGTVFWSDQPAELAARFLLQGWRPEEASLRAKDWDVPGERAKLGAHYARLRGQGRIDWREGKLTADAAVEGQPVEKSAAPPLALKLRAHGDAQGFVAESLEVTLPGVAARLTQPVAIDRAGRLRSSASQFTFEADLEQMPWLDAQGKFAGEGRIAPNDEGLAALEFSGRGENLVWAATRLREIVTNGRFVWPRIELTQVRIVSGNGDELRGAGGWDFRTREVRGATVSGRLRRETFARWLPEQPDFDALEIEARADGPWTNVAHEGHANFDRMRVKGLKPFGAALRWHGRGVEIDAFAAELSAGKTRIEMAGAASSASLTLTTLALSADGTKRLELAQPASMQWAPAWRCDPLHLVGPGAQIDAELSVGQRSNVMADVRGFRSEWLHDIVEIPPVRWTVDALQVRARWADGPAELAVEGTVSVDLGNGRAAQASTRLTGDAKGIVVESLRVAEGETDIVTATGRLPIVLNLSRKPFLSIDAEAPFALDALTSPNPAFWEQISRLARVEISKPEARARLSGTLAALRGEARFRAQRVAVEPGRFAWRFPRIESLDVYLTADRNGVRLDRFGVVVEGQEIRAQGWLPVEPARWRELLRNPRQWGRQGSLHVEVPDAEIAAIAAYFPTYIAPKGRVQLDLTLAEDESLRGFLRVRDATLRPLGPLGVIQEINADVHLDGRTATVEALTGRMGGQVVTLQGRVELPRRGDPKLDFRLKGENLPFVRSAGFLMRGDLDLTLTTPNGAAPRIGGIVTLRDSLFLRDVRSLIPTGAKGAAGRPPYFAIEAPPLNGWGLDVRVHGERFLRLRTPVFNGTATARVALSGTLGEPRATGEAIVDEGTIRLPFANFEVRQGQVRLTAEHAQPQLLVTAVTRRYGYDLRLELTGDASSPNLTFASSPPLDSEQVLLLVMAGQAPEDEFATTGRQRAARFGAFFGQSLLGSFSGDPSGTDRLTISSGENVSEQGRETYNIEYRLNGKWALTGEYDEFDDYYAGVKWRFYQKGGEVRDDE